MKLVHKKVLPFFHAFSVQHWFVVSLVLVATILRFWNLAQSTLFLGDQGRDALVVSRIFLDGHIPAIGPVTSVGDMYLGPLYYYFMAPFLYLSYPSPLGPVYAVAMIGSLTVFFLYYWGRKLVGETGAVIASGICAFSVSAINFSRYSWNPNPIPFVSLVLLFALYQTFQKSAKYWILVGVCFAILFQLHYITILAGGAAGCIWLWQVVHTWRGKDTKKTRQLLQATGIAISLFLLSLTPLVLFDLKHDFLNLHSFQKLITSGDNFTTASSRASSLLITIRETHGIAMHVFFEFLIGKNRVLNTILVCVVVAIIVWSVWKKKAGKYQLGFNILATYLAVGVIGLSTYRNSVFDHYITFLFPAVFLVLGYCLALLWKQTKLGKVAVMLGLLAFLAWNIRQYNFKPQAASLALLATVSDTIHARVRPDEPYAILLLTSTKDYMGMNYRYFLSTDPHKTPLDSSEQAQADTLFIIDEEKLNTQPENSSLYERTAFSGDTVVERYTVPTGPTITVLKDMTKTQAQ